MLTTLQVWITGPRFTGSRHSGGVPAHRPLPEPFADGAFAVRTALASGIGSGRLRGDDLQAVFHGVRVPTSGALAVTDRCAAYAKRMPATEVFSHATAAALFGLPLPTPLRTEQLHVSTFAPRRAPRVRGVVGHQTHRTAVEVGIFHGFPVVSPVDAWCQLAAEMTVRELVIVGDALVRRKHPWSTMDVMRERVEAYRGRRGHQRLVEAVALVRPRTDSPPETELRLDIVAAGMPEPEVNVPIVGRHGREFALGDLVFPKYMVIVEYDGEQHREDNTQYSRDVDRLDDLAELGYRVIRVNKTHRWERRHRVLEKIRAALVARGWRPQARPPST